MAGEKKDPAFLFYVTAWLQSETVRAMSLEARGAYVELLSFAWLHGSIPADHEKLRGLLGVTKARFAKLWPVLQPCWHPAEANAARLVNGRQEAERAERREKAEKNRESGRRGGKQTAKRNEQQQPERLGKRGRSRRSSNDMASAQANAQASAAANAAATPQRTLQPSTPTTRGTPLTPQGEGPIPSGDETAAPRPAAAAERDPDSAAAPPPPRQHDDGASPISDVTAALLRTRYRAGIANGLARRHTVHEQAQRLVGAGLTPDDVEQLDRLAASKSRDDPGALLAHWLDRNEWRGVLDEQRGKAKERSLRARGAPPADERGAEPKTAGSVLDSVLKGAVHA